jgi:uncharacterized protein YyaL (SSP411 family)
MNDLFVNIKVDREERPDIDQIYMSALHHLGEQGGWPLTMFLTPAGEPIWGGTYFPKVSRFGKPAFVDVLRELARLFREEPQRIEQNRRALMERLEAQARPAGRVVIGARELDRVANHIVEAIDPQHGGLKGAPKFPQAAIFELLWRAGERTGDARFFTAIETTLDNICEGGIYDHLGGGFARYSVDERWLAPHFEKMLYDNAHLLELLGLAWQRARKPLYRARAVETVGWLVREMTTAEGAFCASFDADSEGEEGKFYLWSASEVRDVLGEADASTFARVYDVTPAGNFEGHTILNRLRGLAEGATPDQAEEERLAEMRAKLFAARERRVRPGLDDKVLADWNGIMIAALAHASDAFGEPQWLMLAERAFRFVAGSMTRGDRLGHSWRAGQLLFPGLASDHAAMIRAALALHEATADRAYLDQALTWQAALDRHYAKPDGGYFLTADDAEGLIVRPAPTADDAQANHHAHTAANLVRFAALTGDERWRAAADHLFDHLAPAAAANPFAHAAFLNALDFRMRNAEIVVTGIGEPADALWRAARGIAFINRTVLRATDPAALPPSHPAQAQLAAAPADGAAFVCAGETCSLPITEPARIAQAAVRVGA